MNVIRQSYLYFVFAYQILLLERELSVSILWGRLDLFFIMSERKRNSCLIFHQILPMSLLQPPEPATT